MEALRFVRAHSRLPDRAARDPYERSLAGYLAGTA